MHYTKIFDLFWSDEDVRQLDDGPKLLYLYLLTNRHRNMIGLFELPVGYIAEDMRKGSGKGYATVGKWLRELCDKGFVKYSEPEQMLLIPAFLKHNPIENPNQEKKAASLLRNLPETTLFRDFETVLVTLPKRYETLLETVRERYGKQERSKKEEVKRKKEEETGDTGGVGGEPNGADAPPPPENNTTSEKKPYGEEFHHVQLTDAEYEKLGMYGSGMRDTYIDRLDAYIEQIGARAAAKKYRSHYATIQNWIRRDNDGTRGTGPPRKAPPGYDLN